LNGDMFQAPPRRDNVSPFESTPTAQPLMGLNESASLAQNHGVQIHPRPPSAATPASGGHKTGQEYTLGHVCLFLQPRRGDLG